MLSALTQTMHAGNDLSPEQVAEAVRCLVNPDLPAAAKADFLAALARKGETSEELAVFAAELREHSIPPPLDEETRRRDIIDVCGTGGDHLQTFNISTAVALLLAAAGLTVAKHGNRAVTSKSGSADVLEALRIPIEEGPGEAARRMKDQGFAFLFAPHYHPAFRHIGPARKLCAERGERTIFNLLGPLLNPARPSCQLIGVPDARRCRSIAEVLQLMGVRRGMVVSGQAGADQMDELSTLGPNTIAEFYQERALAVTDAAMLSFPFQRATIEDLRGGEAAENAVIIREILEGVECGPKRDVVLLNTAAALVVADCAASFAAGWEMAIELVDSGRARAKLEALQVG